MKKWKVLDLDECWETKTLEQAVKDHETLGCTRHDDGLGFAKMPVGYALMLDHDEAFYYGLRSDGKQSDVCWDKWAIYRWAKADASKPQ